ncbi:hypothetical protein BJX62DRAFT_210420 [Aspergillus germanicus]
MTHLRAQCAIQNTKLARELAQDNRPLGLMIACTQWIAKAMSVTGAQAPLLRLRGSC